MRIYPRIFKFLILPVLLVSCNSGNELILRGKIPLKNKQSTNDPFITENKNRTKFKLLNINKHILNSPDKETDKLNLMALSEMKLENFITSEIIFKTALNFRKNDYALENNIAVLYELMGKDELSLQFYMNAMLHSPGNKKIRENLILFNYKPEKMKVSIP